MIKINGFSSCEKKTTTVGKIALKTSLMSLLKLMIMDLRRSLDGVWWVITVFAVSNESIETEIFTRELRLRK